MQKEKQKKRRSGQQNKALHLYFSHVADAARQSGITYSEFIRRRPRLDMYWTPERVKDIWHTAQEHMYGKTSTSELTTDEIDKVFDVVNKALGEILGLSVPFPSLEEIIHQQEEYEAQHPKPRKVQKNVS